MRNARSIQEVELYKNLYQEQKLFVQYDIKIEKYERNLTNLMKSYNSNKKLKWKFIKIIRGKNSKKEEWLIYDEQGNKLNDPEEKKWNFRAWNQILSKIWKPNLRNMEIWRLRYIYI